MPYYHVLCASFSIEDNTVLPVLTEGFTSISIVEGLVNNIIPDPNICVFECQSEDPIVVTNNSPFYIISTSEYQHVFPQD